MQTNFNLDNFITTFVTKRPQSLLAEDFLKYNTQLTDALMAKVFWLLVALEQLVPPISKPS